ncbi:MAG: hypothetical protein ACREE0_06465 [Phenylobacterium sp.]
MAVVTDSKSRTRSGSDLPDNWRMHAWSPSGEPPLRRLSVRMYDAAWRVYADGLQPLSFANGAQAEAQARALGRGFAAAGFDAAIDVHDAAQALVGTVVYYAHEAPLTASERDQYPWAARRRPGRDGQVATEAGTPTTPQGVNG